MLLDCSPCKICVSVALPPPLTTAHFRQEKRAASVGADHFSHSQSHGDWFIYKRKYVFRNKKVPDHVFNSIAFIMYTDAFSALPLTCSFQGTFKKSKKKNTKNQTKPTKKAQNVWLRKAIQLESNFPFSPGRHILLDSG